jgi:hypothetical protein
VITTASSAAIRASDSLCVFLHTPAKKRANRVWLRFFLLNYIILCAPNEIMQSQSGLNCVGPKIDILHRPKTGKKGRARRLFTWASSHDSDKSTRIVIHNQEEATSHTGVAIFRTGRECCCANFPQNFRLFRLSSTVGRLNLALHLRFEFIRSSRNPKFLFM